MPENRITAFCKVKSIISSLLIILGSVICSIAQTPSPSSVFGGPFTPHGDLRILLIFAGYENECDPAHPSYHDATWPQYNEKQNLPAGKSFLQGYETLFYKDFSQFSDTASDHSISNFYYQMSRHHPENAPLRMVADVFPERINIKGSSHNNHQVFQYIQENYPNFDWSRYDNRPNTPNFRFNNDTFAPDHIIDYVIVIWRGRGLNGYASLSANYKLTTKFSGVEEEYQIRSNCGFTMINSMMHLPGVKALFLHEMAHSLYNCPHYFGTNQVLGSYFYTTNGWGMMNWNQVNTSANAWESWYLGWIELDPGKDLRGPEGGIFTLKDFVTSGDAMRIKIPHTNQHLWLEYHTGISPFDNRDGQKVDGKGQAIPPPSFGLYAFIEGITGDRSKIINPLSLEYANGLKALSGSGNFDYLIKSEQKDPHIYGNITADFTIVKKNPAGSHSGIATIRGNFESDTLYPELIFHRSFTNNGNEPLKICQKTYPYMKGNELHNIWKRDSIYTYECMGTEIAFNQPGQKMGISSNPMIVNLQKYNICEEKMDPVILHGLSVTLLSINSDHSVTVEVKFNDNKIVGNQRFTGNLELKKTEYSEPSLELSRKSRLELEKSGTPNRHSMGETINGKPEFPDFINPTVLTIDSGSTLLLNNKSKLYVKEGSTLLLKRGSKVIFGPKAKLIVQKGSYLAVEQGAEIRIPASGKIILKEGANLGKNPLLKEDEHSLIKIFKELPIKR